MTNRWLAGRRDQEREEENERKKKGKWEKEKKGNKIMDEKKRKEHGKDEEDIVFDFELFSFALSCPPLSFSFLSSIPLLLLVSEVATWKGKTMKRNRKKEIIRLLPKEDISDGRRKRMRERGTERIRE